MVADLSVNENLTRVWGNVIPNKILSQEDKIACATFHVLRICATRRILLLVSLSRYSQSTNIVLYASNGRKHEKSMETFHKLLNLCYNNSYKNYYVMIFVSINAIVPICGHIQH